MTAISNVTAVETGAYSSCATVTGGEMYCWGTNEEGQLGDGTTTDRPSPSAVALDSVTDIAVGSIHTCALTPSELWCWGDNAYGQLGELTVTGRSSPTAVVF